MRSPEGWPPEDCVIENYKDYGIRAINIETLQPKLINGAKGGIERKRRSVPIIVSLTTFPQRVHEVQYVIYSLLNQSMKPDKVVLWLSKEEFERGADDLPENLTRWLKCGLEIEWCDNLRQYNKLVPSLRKYPDAIIITADDDIFYPEHWVKGLYEDYRDNGDKYIYAYRVHRMCLTELGLKKYTEWEREIKGGASTLNFPTGVGGVLYPPKSLAESAQDSDIFMRISATNDDIWFWAMALINNKKIKVTPGFDGLIFINPDRELRLADGLTLARLNVVQSANDEQLNRVIKAYPQLVVLLRAESEFLT